MDLIELLGQLDDLGIDVKLDAGIDGDRLLFHPVEAMPPELLVELRRQKAAVVAHFKLLADAPGMAMRG